MSSLRSALILGGGLAGLTCAHELAQAGVEVTVLEKLPVLGGLARNVAFGGAKFDLGGHRFFTAKPELLAWLQGLLGDKLHQVGRKSRILMGGRYFDYPLRALNALSGFGLRDTVKILTDYTEAAIRRSLSTDADITFEDWVMHRYGHRLFEIYFKPYTEKVWGVPCDRISAAWAAQRIQLLSLTDAVVQALWPRSDGPKTYAQSFWYPTGGIGLIAETLAAKIHEQGGKIRTGCAVERIVVRKRKVVEVVAEGETFRANMVISTIPLTLLGRLTGAPVGAVDELGYRAIRCLYLLLDMEQVTDDTWLYFPEADVVFGRCHEPRNWDADLAPPQGTSLCLEVFCNEGDEQWSRDDKELAADCVAGLDRLGLVRPSQVTDSFGERVSHAYPMFYVGYQRPLRTVLEHAQGIANLHPLGRTGTYQYHNMDQVVEAAMELAGKLVKA